MKLAQIATCGTILMALSAHSVAAAPALATKNVNLRQGPGTNFPIITTIPGGSNADVKDCQEWCSVTWQGQSGFAISTSFDRGNYPPPPAGAAGPPPRGGPPPGPPPPGYGPRPHLPAHSAAVQFPPIPQATARRLPATIRRRPDITRHPAITAPITPTAPIGAAGGGSARSRFDRLKRRALHARSMRDWRSSIAVAKP